MWIITRNVNQKRVSWEVFKTWPDTSCLQETDFKFKGAVRLKLKGWKKTPCANIYPKQGGMNI